MRRRTLLVSGLAASAIPLQRVAAAESTTGVPPTGRILFEVFRNESRIGTHTLDFTCAGQSVTARIAIRLAAGLGPITLYRYAMDATERWEGGRFVALDTATNDDGTAHAVSVRRSGEGLLVRANGEPPSQLPGNALPLTHWAIATMSAPLFNPQDGTPIPDRAVPEASEAVRMLNGSSVQAKGYRLTGAFALQDWYDESQLWVKLKAKAKDGSDIDYRRT